MISPSRNALEGMRRGKKQTGAGFFRTSHALHSVATPRTSEGWILVARSNGSAMDYPARPRLKAGAARDPVIDCVWSMPKWC